MYLYLYDSFLNNKKQNSLLAKIETRLTDLGIGGKIYRLSPLRNIKELLNDETKNGVKTVVIVGNDKTLTQVINISAHLDVIYGLIPVGPDNKIAQTLGIPSAEEACDILAARKVERIDLGKVNDIYFLSNLTIAGDQMTIECDDRYKITPQCKNAINVCNLRPLFAADFSQDYFNPQDGQLEILIQPLASNFQKLFNKSTLAKTSIISFKKIAIRNKNPLFVTTDGQKVLKSPIRIEVIPKKLRIIVGKNRLF